MSDQRTTVKIPSEIVEYHSELVGVSHSVAQGHFVELAKFLFACAEEDCSLVPSIDVDEAWHTFLLFTREYREWCEACFGRMIDHRPLTKIERTAALEYFKNTVAIVDRRFGIEKPLWEKGAWSKALV